MPDEPAHLLDARGFSPPVHRHAPDPAMADLVRRYWVPVWSLPPGETSVQRVLRYPVCLVVVSDSYARFYGPATGLSRQELSGSGWACGVMLQPAAGSLLLGGSVAGLVDQIMALDSVPGLQTVDVASLVGGVRKQLTADPGDPARRTAACALVEGALRTLLPVDDEGLLVNAVLDHVEGDPQVVRVGQVCEKFDLTERTLQRMMLRRVGLSPKWLIQRRRLQDAAALLATGNDRGLARIAAELGYADQAHLSRDFRTVTGLTPRQFAREPRPPAG